MAQATLDECMKQHQHIKSISGDVPTDDRELLLFVMMRLPESQTISTEDVHALTTEINTLTSSTWDIIEKFKHISKHTVNFVRVATPVGSLIAAAAEIAYPPESEEFQAIKKLHDAVNQINFAFIRYHDNQYERAARAHRWYATTGSPQMKSIISNWILFNNSLPLVTLQNKLTELVQGFGDPDLFPHVILLHNWNFITEAANITYGDTTITIRGEPKVRG
uniref:AKAP7_NLS domain-containing protein n=1 Tax=Globodera pallida TaxID=36090 RepID=A0A183CIQ8_GLOPA